MMRKIKYLFLPSILWLLLSACSNYSYRSSLIRIDSLVVDSPQVALARLHLLEREMADASLGEKCYFQLLTLKVKDQLFIPPKNDSVARDLLKYYENEGDRRMLPEVYYYMGKTYVALNDFPQGTEHFLNVLETEKDTSSQLAARTYYQLGRIYTQQWMDLEAERMFRKALECDKARMDTMGMVYDLREIASSLMHQDKYDAALPPLLKARAYSREHGYKQLFVTTSSQLSRLYLRRKDYAKALTYVKEAISKGTPQETEAAMTFAASIYEQLGKDDSAAMFHRKLLHANSIYARRDAYKGLSLYYYKIGDVQKTLECSRMFAFYVDSIQRNTQTEIVHKKKSMYDYSLREAENARLKNEIHERNVALVILCSMMSVVAIVGFFALLYFGEKKKTSKIKSFFLGTMQRVMSEHPVSFEQKDRAMQETDVVRNILKIVNNPQGKRRLEDDVWDFLQHAVNDNYPGFDEKLHGLCRMSLQDYHICLLIKIKLRLSDIADFANLTNSGLNSVRRKLYKRALGKAGGAEDWDRIIASL